ncbi:methyl-accepting chemotaxis protein [Amphritea sp. HPY]|uniref:methyl-accepting chemotaxis protein n=1 Tax=Amphritea sp. HPY TaxID=3421652 RepID=UPI003D7D78DB
MTMKLTIKEKMYLLAAAVALVSLLILSIALYGTHTLDQISSTQDLARQVNSQMLMMRRYEKDFISRNDLKYQQKFHQQMEELKTNSQTLTEFKAEAGIPTDNITGLITIFNKYDAEFDRLVDIQKQLGFDHKTGLHGKLRKAVRDAEEQLASTGDLSLTNAILELRRNEKDFIQRKELSYSAQFDDNLRRFMTVLDNSHISNANKHSISNLMKAYNTSFQNMVAGYKDRGLDSTSGIQGDMRAAAHQSEALLQEVIADTLGMTKIRHDQVETAITVSVLVLASLLVISLILLVRNIVGALERIVNQMKCIAEGEGDLRVRLPDEGRDEIARLSASFNLFVSRIQELVKEVSDAALSLADAAEKSAASVDQTAEMLNQQQHETDQVASAITEMSATVAEVASSAATAAQATQAANADSQRGKDVVDESASAIRNLASEVEAAADVIHQLSERSVSIGSVVDVISEVAEQTNLLALNAAIEAARAGDQGRGFAVVADEVRILAQRTQNATNDIHTMIEELQHGTQNATTVMETSRESAGIVVSQAVDAGQALDSITDGVSTISDLNTQIASSSEQQAAVSDEISKSIINISNYAQQTSASASQIRTASSELAQLSQKLFSLTSQFKV